MIAFLRMVDVEFFKLKRSFVWFVVIIAPLAMILSGTSNFYRFKEVLLQQDGVAWIKLYVQIVFWYSMLLLPMSIGVLSILHSRTEHSENSWKYLLTLPVPRGRVYLAKLTVLIILTGVSICILGAGVYASGQLLGITEPFPYSMVIGNLAIGWLVCWPIISIQMWLSTRFPGIGTPMGVSAATAISGVLIANSKYGGLYLWSFPALSMMPKGQVKLDLSDWYVIVISMIVLVVCTFLGLRDFMRRDVQ